MKVGGHDVGRSTFEPGWRWSVHAKPRSSTETCRSNHTGVILEGRMVIRMEGGEEIE